MSDGGKGSTPRPIPNWDRFSDNFDAIFGKKDDSKAQNIESLGRQEKSNDSGHGGRPTDAE